MKPFLLSAFIALTGTTLAYAQTIYRIERPDGRITFSDRLPTKPSDGKVVSTGTGAQAIASTLNLPFELKQVVSKYPVTIYTAPQCVPCDAGRAQLSARGVPFAERTVATAEDSTQLQRISGDATLPFMTIGSQRVKGYSAPEWTQYLDAAGYPASSMLPAGYKNAAATPLVPVSVAAAKPTPKESAPVVPTVNNDSNPAGITF
jgi:glutaredoxin